MTSQDRIAVIIPCFNVEKHIEKVVRGIPSFVEKIIAVNDASTDQTLNILKGLSEPRLLVINHMQNQGVGGAVLSGYETAQKEGFDIFVKMDGDGQMRPEFLADLLEPLKARNAHYTKGNRFTDYKFIQDMPLVRRFGNTWLSFFAKLVSGYWNIFDVTNGYTAILAETFRKINPRHVAKGYYFEISMLTELNIVGAKIVDVDIPSYYGDEKSHLSINRTATFFPGLLLRGFFHRFYGRYIIRDFNVFSLCFLSGFPLFLFGVAYGFFLWIYPPVPGEPTPAGMVMFAALPIILGFQLILTALILDVVQTPNTNPKKR